MTWRIPMRCAGFLIALLPALLYKASDAFVPTMLGFTGGMLYAISVFWLGPQPK